MSDKYTRIQLPDGSHSTGLLEHGEISVKEAISRFRRYYEHKLRMAQHVLSKSDGEFQIDVVRGPIAERHVKTLQTAISQTNEYRGLKAVNAIAVKAVWNMLDERGLLKGVGSDLHDEIKSDLAVAMQVHNHEMQEAIDNAIEQITAHLVHGEVSKEGWQALLNELVAVQKGINQ